MSDRVASRYSYSVTGLGQDSHVFSDDADRPLVLAGITIDGHRGLEGNSDADVVLHALCNALSSISGEAVLGAVADQLCQQGITDSRAYLARAMATLTEHRLVHIAVSLECSTPKLAPWIVPMRQSIADLCGLALPQVGMTATSGEGLTAFGQGKGIQVLAIVTALQAADTSALVDS